jgi:hypothetical protein
MEKKLNEVKKKVLSALSLDSLPAPVTSQLHSISKVMKNKIYVPSKKLMRKVVTGDEKKRVRDLIKEKKDKPQYIKLFDKISFTLFTLTLPICQYFLLNRPQYFWIWFSFIIPILLVARYFYFHSIKMEYFLYDFCYFSNLLSLLTIYYTPQWLFRMVFIFVNGPVTLAILVWRLSLVFHDFDRVTSIYIHLLPAALFFVLRWQVIPAEMIQSLGFRDFLNACMGYLFWQVAYFLKTEVFDREKLDSNPELLTSLRWLATDKKNATARFVLKLLRTVGIMRRDEDYVSTEFKTKFIFMTSQFVYTVFTFLPSFLVYYSYHLHLLYILLVFTNSVYNGASFYIEIFSQRYQLQFAKKEDMQQVVQAATEIAIQAAAAAANSATLISDPASPIDTPPSGILTMNDQQPAENGPGGDASQPGSPQKRMAGDANEFPSEQENNEEEEDKTLRRNESIRVAIEEATAAFVEEWAAADDDHSCATSEGRLSDLDSEHNPNFIEEELSNQQFPSTDSTTEHSQDRTTTHSPEPEPEKNADTNAKLDGVETGGDEDVLKDKDV